MGCLFLRKRIMTIAVQRNTDGSDTIFFDAVLSYTSAYTSKLTSNPIDGQKNKDGIYNVSDHIVTENPSFSIKGVISGADFGAGRPSASEYSLANGVSISESTSVNSTTDSIFNSVAGSLLPFGKNADPEVTVGTRVGTPLPLIKNLLISIRENRETVTLVEFTNGKPTNTELNLVITSLQFSEDANTGDSLSIDMTLQKANFVELLWTRTSIKSSGSTKDKAQQTVDKGAQTTTTDKSVLQELSEGELEKYVPIDALSKYYDRVQAAIRARSAQ